MEEIYTLEEALASLNAEQAQELAAMVDKYGEEEAASHWLDEVAAKQLPITPYSGNIAGENEEPKSFSARVKEQLDRLICGAPEYEEERKKILEKGSFFTLSAASIAAAWLGGMFGITAGAIAPGIVLILRVVGKVGINAYCANKNID